MVQYILWAKVCIEPNLRHIVSNGLNCFFVKYFLAYLILKICGLATISTNPSNQRASLFLPLQQLKMKKLWSNLTKLWKRDDQILLNYEQVMIKSYPTVAFLILTFCGFTAISVLPSEFVNSIAMINSFNWKCIMIVATVFLGKKHI